MVAPSGTGVVQDERALAEESDSSCKRSRRENVRPAAYCAVCTAPADFGPWAQSLLGKDDQAICSDRCWRRWQRARSRQVLQTPSICSAA